MRERTVRIETTFSSGKFTAFRAIESSIKETDETFHFKSVRFGAENITENVTHSVNIQKSKVDFFEFSEEDDIEIIE